MLRAAVRRQWPLWLLRWGLVVGGTPLLLVPIAWAAWVALVLGATSRLGRTSAVLWRRRGGTVEIEGALARIVWGRRASPVVKVRRGWLEPWRGELTVVLEGERGLRLVAQVQSEAQGREMLRAAGVDEARQVLRVPLGSLAMLLGQGATFHLLAPVLLALMGLGPLMALVQSVHHVQQTGRGWGDVLLYGGSVIGVAAIALGLGWMLVPGEAVVGRDGVSLRRLWNQRFFGFSRVRRSMRTEHGAELQLTDGSTIQLPTATFFDRDPGRRDALVRRLHDAMVDWSSRPAPPLPSSFERQGQTVAAWGQKLRDALGAATYRHDTLESNDLVRLLEAPAAPLEHRVGAALALAQAPLEGEERRRVDDAIASSAHAPARRVLRLALDGQLADLDLEAALLDDSLSAGAAHALEPAARASSPDPPARPAR